MNTTLRLCVFSIFLWPNVALAQVPSQVFSLTVGSRGTVQATRTSKDHKQENAFSFSTSSDEQTLNTTNQKPTDSRRGGKQTQKERSQVSTFSYTIETGTLKQRKRVKVSDTYSFTETNFNQSFSIDY